MNGLLIPLWAGLQGATATETRKRLLRAAADAFAERGYDGTAWPTSPRPAGVSNGALYAHFGSKAGPARGGAA